MTYTVFNTADGFHYIYDTASGAVIPVGELEAYICDAMDPCGDSIDRMPDKCPSDIRYELARFSSTEVSAAYSKVKELFANGLIYCSSDSMSIRACGDYSSDDKTIRFILSEAGLSSDKVTILK